MGRDGSRILSVCGMRWVGGQLEDDPLRQRIFLVRQQPALLLARMPELEARVVKHKDACVRLIRERCSDVERACRCCRSSARYNALGVPLILETSCCHGR